MTKFTLKVTQTNAFHIDIEADSFEEAETAYYHLQLEQLDTQKYDVYFNEEIEDDSPTPDGEEFINEIKRLFCLDFADSEPLPSWFMKAFNEVEDKAWLDRVADDSNDLEDYDFSEAISFMTDVFQRQRYTQRPGVRELGEALDKLDHIRIYGEE